MKKIIIVSIFISLLVIFFVGCPNLLDNGDTDDTVDTGIDTDGDGISDAVETEGWYIEIDLNGDGDMEDIDESRHVTSDPNKQDTDGDGLTDYEEKTSSKSDPRVEDTDSDGLTDYAENKRYGSSAYKVDSDGDSQGDDKLFDGSEINTYGTSPTLADTDGDGLSDFYEINTGGYNPRVADIPQMDLTIVTDPLIILSVTYEDGGSTETQDYEATLISDTSGTSKTDSSSTSHTIENSESISATVAAEASITPSASVSVTGEVSFTESTTNEESVSFTQDSSHTAQTEHQQYLTNGSTKTETASVGKISTGFTIKNTGVITFEVDNLQVTVLKRDLYNPNSVKVYATLAPSRIDGVVGRYTLAPGVATGTLGVTNAEVEAPLIKELLQNPEGLFFDVAYFDLYDGDGYNYAYIGQSVDAQTGLLTIDYNSINTLPVEKYSIATNVYRNEDGTTAGITLGEILSDVLAIDYDTDTQNGNLKSVKTVATATDTPLENGFWIVLGSGESFNNTDIAFDDIVLKNREFISLVYVKDQDGDGLFDREEFIYGTNINSADTDIDGISDYDEIRVGWDVSVVGQNTRKVYSSAINSDADNDNLDDTAERTAGTDPNNPDTDGDGFNDNVDPNPTQTTVVGPEIDTWATATSFNIARRGHASVVHNGFLYVIGGQDSSMTNINSVEYASINADGTIGSWNTTASLYTALYAPTSVVYNGYIYVIGGRDPGNTQNIVQYAPINADGTIGSWTATSSLNTARYSHSSVVYNGYLYVFDGLDVDSGFLNSVEYASINANGTIGSWTTTTSLNTARIGSISVVYNEYLYVFGGYEDGSYTVDVEYALINDNGSIGPWNTTTPLDTGLNGPTGVVYNGYLYLIGGLYGSMRDEVKYALINPDNGTIGSWTPTTPFITARYQCSSVVYNGYLYVIGGMDADSNFLNDVEYVPFVIQ